MRFVIIIVCYILVMRLIMTNHSVIRGVRRVARHGMSCIRVRVKSAVEACYLATAAYMDCGRP